MHPMWYYSGCQGLRLVGQTRCPARTPTLTRSYSCSAKGSSGGGVCRKHLSGGINTSQRITTRMVENFFSPVGLTLGYIGVTISPARLRTILIYNPSEKCPQAFSDSTYSPGADLLTFKIRARQVFGHASLPWYFCKKPSSLLCGPCRWTKDEIEYMQIQILKVYIRHCAPSYGIGDIGAQSVSSSQTMVSYARR